jgi:hypothetical protein
MLLNLFLQEDKTMFKFWKKKEKSQEEILKEMRTAEKVRLMETIQKNAAEGKPESDNLIVLKEMNLHASIDAEDEKMETERSNRRSKAEKFVSMGAPIAMTGIAFWNAKRDSNGENTTRSQGGKTLQRLVDGATSKFNDLTSKFKK